MMLTDQGTLAPDALPVEALRDHLRLGTGFADDSLQDAVLAGFLRAALAAIEGRTGKALIEREFVWTVTRAVTGARLVLPVAPVSAVARFEVIDAEGLATPVPAGVWRLVPDAHAPAILSLTGAFPALPTGGIIEIALLAGYGPEWTDLPGDLAQAVLMLAAHYYEYRNDTGLGPGCMPFGVSSLIERHRAIRLGLTGAPA